MIAILQHLEVAIPTLISLVSLISWFVRLEMKVRALQKEFEACRAGKVFPGDIGEKVHSVYDDIQKSLTAILVRLTRVETKIDKKNGGDK